MSLKQETIHIFLFQWFAIKALRRVGRYHRHQFLFIIANHFRKGIICFHIHQWFLMILC
ncbi:hypothetical protein GLOIN_2v1708753, partial [Rhizophagus irregularis DAOM 181602=DAOM 197198]